MKKFIILISFFLTGCAKYWRSTAPEIHCDGLPGCRGSGTSQNIIDYINNFIALLIQYVWVIAVIAVMISGIMYIVSAGEEERVNQAKRWIIWSLLGVFFSILGWWIINALNNIDILW